MTKINYFALLFSALVLTHAYSLPEFNINMGAGCYATGDFGGGFYSTGNKYLESTLTPYYSGAWPFVFFDMTYVEISIGFFKATGTWSSYSAPLLDANIFLTGLDTGVSLKYPFIFNKYITLFPMANINYRTILSLNIGYPPLYALGWNLADLNSSDLNALWFKFGAGFDYVITDRVFLRINALYGFRLHNKIERETKGAGTYAVYKILPGHGYDIKCAICFKFKKNPKI